MIGNHTSLKVGYICGKYPNRIGHLYSPGSERGPYPFLPYALDNGAYSAWVDGRSFDYNGWERLLDWASMQQQQPLWALVPDVVANMDATLRMWHERVSIVKARGFKTAFAVQDGMTTDDVPTDADVVFVGGTTEWKQDAIPVFSGMFHGRTHVGRVNTWDRLMLCFRSGVVSVDGTGWYHNKQMSDLMSFIEQTECCTDGGR